ncbi:Alpha/Beta hydrolase protein [Glomus cerebriforme]|uniref:Alpha/Beta hydrolase protein n=1 Tax=Glomus cerebriforme TaxID=658196 RepID=A0A397S7P7_9GLOM|nr:Alpha/Beta hydrolase protein [Glomus cerebriforme]
MAQLPSIQRVFLESIVSSSDPEGRFIEVNGIQTFYKLAIPQIHQQLLQNQRLIPNEPNKPVILLLHHILGNQYTWRYHLQPLADATGCHVIAYDRPTFGFTERPTEWENGKNPYTQEASVEFALQLVFNLGYTEKKIAFVGVSSGAAISSFVAIKYPHLVHSLCLLGASLTPEDQGPPPVGRHILGSAPGRLFLKAALYRYLPLTSLYHDTNSIPDWETVVKPNYRVPLTFPNFYESLSWLMKYFVPLEVLPNKEYLARVPILYITGDDDRYLHVDRHKEIFDDIASVAPQNAILEYKVLNNCGHLPQDEKPQEVLDSIVNFLFRVGI